MTCSSCHRPAKKAGLCWGHYAHKRDGKPEGLPLDDRRGSLTPRELLKKAALSFADVEGSEAKFAAAEWRLVYAALRVALSAGWTPNRAWRGWKYDGKRWTEKKAAQR